MVEHIIVKRIPNDLDGSDRLVRTHLVLAQGHGNTLYTMHVSKYCVILNYQYYQLFY